MRGLVDRLQITSAMINMGERIAWGHDTGLMDEAAAELVRLQSEAGKMLADMDAEYNRKTNSMIARHAEVVATLRKRIEADAKAHEKEIAVWAENYAALERRLAEFEGIGE